MRGLSAASWWRRDLILFLCVYLVVGPTAAFGDGDDCESKRLDPVDALTDIVDDAREAAPPDTGPPISFRDPRMPFAIPRAGTDAVIPIGRIFEEASQALTALEANAKKKKFEPLLPQMRAVRERVRAARVALEEALDSAARDPQWLPSVEAALHKYYARDGLLWRYHELYARAHFQKVLPLREGDEPQRSFASYDQLSDLWVKGSPEVLAGLTGDWLGVVDALKLDDGIVRYNSFSEVTLDQEAIASWTGDDRHLWNIGLELAHTQINNWVSMDMLRPDGGQRLPCVGWRLRSRYPSLNHPDDMTAYMRHLTSESAFRQQLANETADTLAHAPTLVTPEVIRAIRHTVTVPRFSEPPAAAAQLTPERYDQVLAGVFGKAENQLAPLRFKQLLKESPVPLSQLTEEARAKRVAALATQARTWAFMQGINQLIEDYNDDPTRPHAAKNDEEWRKRRLNALIDGGFLNRYADDLYTRLMDHGLPSPRRIEPGETLDTYADAVVQASRATGQFAEDIRLVTGGLPLSRDIKVTPALVWALKREGLERRHALGEMYTTDNGDSVLETLDRLLSSPRPFLDLKADLFALRERAGEREQKALSEVFVSLGMTGNEAPSLTSVFRGKEVRDALSAYLRAGIDNLPMISQPMSSHDDQPLYQVLFNLYEENRPLYRTTSPLDLTVREDTVRHYVRGDLQDEDETAARVYRKRDWTRDATREAQAAIDETLRPLREQMEADQQRLSEYTDELVLDPRDPMARALLNAIQSGRGRLFQRWGNTLAVDRAGVDSVTYARGQAFDQTVSRIDTMLRDTLRSQHLYVVANPTLGERGALISDVRDANHQRPQIVIVDDSGTTRIPKSDPWASVLLRATAGTNRVQVDEQWVTIPGTDTLAPRLRSLRDDPHQSHRDGQDVPLLVDALRPAAQPLVKVREDGKLVFSKSALVRALTPEAVFEGRDYQLAAPWALGHDMQLPNALDTHRIAGTTVTAARLWRAGDKDQALEVTNRERTRLGWNVITVEDLDDSFTPKDPPPAFVWDPGRSRVVLGTPDTRFPLFTPGLQTLDPRFTFLAPWQQTQDPLAQLFGGTYYGQLPPVPRDNVPQYLSAPGSSRPDPATLVRRLDTLRARRADYEKAIARYMDDYADATATYYDEGGWAVSMLASERLRANPDHSWSDVRDVADDYCSQDVCEALADYWHDVNAQRLDPVYLFARNPEKKLLGILYAVSAFGENGPHYARAYERFSEQLDTLTREWNTEVAESTEKLDEAVDNIREFSRTSEYGGFLGIGTSRNRHRDVLREFANRRRPEIAELRRQLTQRRRILTALRDALPSESELDDYKSPSEGIRDALDSAHLASRQRAMALALRHGVSPTTFDQAWQRAVEQGQINPVFEGTGKDAQLNALDWNMTPSYADVRRLMEALRADYTNQKMYSPVAMSRERLDDARDDLTKDAEPFMPMHQEVLDSIGKYVVLDALREQLKKVCENLEEVSQMRDRDEMEKLLLAEGARAALLARFPQFKGIDERMVQEFFDYQTQAEKATHWVTTIVILGLFVTAFIPGVNLVTGAAAPYIAVLLPTLFAAEAAWTVRDMGVLNDRIRFAESMGKTTSMQGRMLANERVTEALRDELGGKKIDLALDTAFALFEGYRAFKLFRSLARGGVLPLSEATGNLAKRGVKIEAGMSMGEADSAFRTWAQEAKISPELYEQGTAQWRRAARELAAAQDALRAWKVSKASAVLNAHGLELPRNPTHEQITKAFRDWISRTKSHPDKWAGDALKQREAARRFQEVNESLEVWREHLEQLRRAPSVSGVDTHVPLDPLPALPGPSR